MIQNITDAEFQLLLSTEKLPIIVDFWAEWCAPCKIIGTDLESLSKDYEGKVVIVKLDIDSQQVTASEFGIRSIPTVILFQKGKEESRIVGADLNKIRKLFEQFS